MCVCVCAEPSGGAALPLVAVEGDIVTLNWRCLNEEGEVWAPSNTCLMPTFLPTLLRPRSPGGGKEAGGLLLAPA